jgi:hypothetical protein
MNPHFERLLNRWLDGELEGPEAEAVQRVLADDPDARRMCYELLMVDRLLDERAGSRPENVTMMDAIARGMVNGRAKWKFGFKPLVIAAMVALSLVGTFLFFRPRPAATVHAGPNITGSTDSRITIAQRQDASQWNTGELLRLERGSADIKFNSKVSATVEGPAALELIHAESGVRLLEGMASFSIGAAHGVFEVQVPGGELREIDCRFTVDVRADGIAQLRAESGFLEIRRRNGMEPVYLKPGEALSLEPDGKAQPIRLPNQHFRSGLPQQVALFREVFEAAEETKLSEHSPEIGQAWKILSEANPTLIRRQRLDTSSGARKLVANLAPHDNSSPRTVYIFSFDLLPPEWIQDKVKRQGGLEYITLLDGSGNQIVSISARASNSHRWQLIDEKSKAASALTPVCSLWTHSLTLCYGMDGLVTLHDGATAQAPIIAELRVATPPPISGMLIGNWDGGDLALSRMEAVLLPGPPVDPQ